MQRYGSVIKLKPEKLQEYRELHAHPWPEVIRMIHDCNIRNYTIYYKDGSKRMAQRDQTMPFLEQMHYLGVSDSQLANPEYEITRPSQLTGEKATNAILLNNRIAQSLGLIERERPPAEVGLTAGATTIARL